MKHHSVETPAGRVMFIRAPKRLSPAQLAQALGSMADDDPRWLGFHQILDEELSAAALDVSAPTAVNRDHAGGRMDALATLKQRLLTARQAPAAPEKPAPRKR
jgi:hypothetical protein